MAALIDSIRGNPPRTSPVRDIEYGSIESSSCSARNDSAVGVSPTEPSRPGYSHPHQHRIIPPSISGHGRLIVAHRIVPYWIGAGIVIGAFAWAVWCAIYVYLLLGGHPNDWKSGNGTQHYF